MYVINNMIINMIICTLIDKAKYVVDANVKSTWNLGKGSFRACLQTISQSNCFAF